MSESAFEQTTRQGIETRINEAYLANDIRQVDNQLDLYPYGKKRPLVSLEVARHAVSQCNTGSTIEFDPIKA